MRDELLQPSHYNCYLPSAAMQRRGHCCCQHGAKDMKLQGDTISRQLLFSHTHREANTGREQQGLNVLTGKALEALWEGGCARAKSHSLCLHRSSEERALNATQSHLWAFQISGSLRPLKKSGQKQAGFRLVEARCLCRRLIGSVLEWVTWAIKHIFSTGNECGLF